MRPNQFLSPAALVFAAILLAIVQAVAATPDTCYPPLALATEGIPPATAGSSYSTLLVAKGGQPPYTWSFGQSQLPPGFSINSGGKLIGTPATGGDYNFHVVVTDSLKNSVTAGYTLTVADSAGTSSGPTQGSTTPPDSPPTTKPAPPPTTTPTPPPASEPAPTIAAISPDSAPVAGGTTVTISGKNFESGATVRFGKTSSPSTQVVGSTEIRAVVPAGSAGVVNISVANADGEIATAAAAFTYIAPASGGSGSGGSGSGGSGAPGFVAPELPQATVNLALPTQGTSACPTLTTGSNCIRNVPAGDAANFQKAINAATCGDTIVLQAGSTYSGNFTIPATSCTGWIEIVSSKLASLPAPGNRVSPSEAADMPVISTPNVAPAIEFLPQSNHWRLVGVEFTSSLNSTTYVVHNLVKMGYYKDSTEIDKLSDFPSYLVFDRDYIEGDPQGNVSRGILANGLNVALVDSYCADIHDNQNFDSQCLDALNGTGPILVQNNFLSAGSEDLAFGGGDPPVQGWSPSDITVVGNVMQKDTSWRGLKAPYNWNIKNNFELKNAKRLLLDGNVMQYTWDDAQHEAIIIRSDDQEGKCTWCTVADITITHNLIRHAADGIVLDALNLGDGVSLPTTRVLIQNNLLTDISDKVWGSGNQSNGYAFELLAVDGYASLDWTIDHNTAFSGNGAIELAYDNMGNKLDGVIDDLTITNNVMNAGPYGIFGQGVSGAKAALNTFAPNYTYNQNVLLGAKQSGYPDGTYWNTISTSGFTSVTGRNPNISGNLQLTGSSPYLNAGTDGKDIGVEDWTCFNASTQAALAGKYNASIGSCFRGSKD